MRVRGGVEMLLDSTASSYSISERQGNILMGIIIMKWDKGGIINTS
jgi:hypothetical protein